MPSGSFDFLRLHGAGRHCQFTPRTTLVQPLGPGCLPVVEVASHADESAPSVTAQEASVNEGWRERQTMSDGAERLRLQAIELPV